MNVETIATKNVITVREGDSMLSASGLIKQNGIRHLPVLDDRERLVGVVTDRDIKRMSASEATSLEIHELLYLVDKIVVKRVMRRDPITVAPGTSVQEAAKLMVDRKIGCLPVVSGEKLVGIVTGIDLLGLVAREG